MGSLATLAQSLGIAYASGISLYATVAVLGVAHRMGWIDNLPAGLQGVSSWWVIVIAASLYAFEFLATLLPGIASAWETFHSLVRPPAAAGLAAATAWQGEPSFIALAALLGGGLALTTHATKLGVRYAIDTSPEPVTNGAANIAEFGVVATMAIAVWNHPYISLTLALVLLVLMALLVRAVWRAVKHTFTRGRAATE
jgi:hypothetical protein